MSESLYTTQVPSATFDDGIGITVGTVMSFAVDGVVSAIRWFSPNFAPPGTPIGLLYTWGTPGVELQRANFGAFVANTWMETAITPVAVSAGTLYVPAVWSPSKYTALGHVFDTDVVNGDITGPHDTALVHNGVFNEPSAAPTYPASSFNATAYFADLVFTPNSGSPSGLLDTGKGHALSTKTQYVMAANATSAVFDANDYYTNIGFDVTAGGGATLWSVQLQASIDNVNFKNIGFPTANAGTIGTTIGPVTQATQQTGFWSAGAYRYFRFVLSTLDAGNVTINLAAR